MTSEEGLPEKMLEPLGRSLGILMHHVAVTEVRLGNTLPSQRTERGLEVVSYDPSTRSLRMHCHLEESLQEVFIQVCAEDHRAEIIQDVVEYVKKLSKRYFG